MGAGSIGVMGLHQQQQQDAVQQQSMSLGSPVATVLDAPEVQIQHSRLFNYYLVEIKCRDRNKLFFDTVCEWPLAAWFSGCIGVAGSVVALCFSGRKVVRSVGRSAQAAVADALCSQPKQRRTVHAMLGWSGVLVVSDRMRCRVLQAL
jgi:hypothetical protein